MVSPSVPAAKNAAASPNLNTLATLLRSRPAFHHVHTVQYPSRFQTPEEFITTHRLILILEGDSRYTVEGVTTSIHAGQMIFVPAWTHRVWHACGRQRCRHFWCEFSDEGLELDLRSLFIHKHPRMALEKAALARMLRLWPGDLRFCVPGTTPSLTPQVRLQLEGELKAILSRFWPGAKAARPQFDNGETESRSIHTELKHALHWLNHHFLDPHALQRLYEEIHLSPNHFRLLFHRDLHCSPQQYLMRLRLRRARILVIGSELNFKEIATATGFGDPLFFSRQYRLFFGSSPRADRQQPRL